MKRIKNVLKFLPAFIFLLVAISGFVYNEVARCQNLVYAQDENYVEKTEITDNYDSTKFIVLYKEEQRFKADRATINVQVESLDIDQNVAKEKNKEIVSEIIEELNNQGVANEDIKITYNSCCPCKDGVPVSSNGYRVYTNLSYSIKNIEDISSSIEKIEELNAYVMSIEYKLSDFKEKYNNVLTLAIENAKAKAKKLFNKDSINVLKIKEEKQYYCNSRYQSYYEGMTDIFTNAEIEIVAEIEIEVA